MNRFREFRNKDNVVVYKVDRYLIAFTFFIIFLYLLFILKYDNWSGQTHVYSECTSNNEYCYNAIYNSEFCTNGIINPDDSLCTIEKMYPGQLLGIKPPWFITSFSEICFGLVILSLLLNTLLYNKGFFKRRIDL